jgi:hypothetical protein
MNIISLWRFFLKWKFNNLYQPATTGPRILKEELFWMGKKRKQFRRKINNTAATM